MLISPGPWLASDKMMKSNVLSRVLPAGEPSVYEAIREHDADSNESDIEERAGLAWNEDDEAGTGPYNDRELEEPGTAQYDDRELEEAMADAQASGMTSPTTSTTAFLQRQPRQEQSQDDGKARRRKSRPRWLSPRVEADEDEDDDDDVPASLLVEGNQNDEELKSLPPPPHQTSPEPGPSRLQWEAEPQRDTGDTGHGRPAQTRWSIGQHPNLAFADPKEKAMWRWANVENLDNFLAEVYAYYMDKGIWMIVLNRVLGLLTFGFIVGFTTFLANCVDYSHIRGSHALHEILISRCTAKMSTLSTLFLWLVTFSWFQRLFRYAVDLRRLKHLHDFFYYLLDISNNEIQTISWQDVVSRLMALRDANPATAQVSRRHRRLLGSQSKQRMDAHDIANRLMRKENYLIALVNKDILDLRLPIPFFRNRQLFSKTLEWNINLCVMDYLFNEQGQIKTLFLKDTHRKILAEGLRRRFLVVGVLNIVAAPFLVAYNLMEHFFRYFNEYKRNPSQIGARQYTPLAEWKFREFNELEHLFRLRARSSYPLASRYIDQFPKYMTSQVAGFIALISGAITSVLALASLVDPELFLGFEVTTDRTVLFYLGVFGTVWAVAQGMAPERNDVFDPEYAMLEVIQITHYFPSHWKGRLHRDDVHGEFSTLYQMRIVIFIEELLSMIFTPFVLWFSLPQCSERIIDFFREFTVHVDGLGYLCSFAVFDFKKGTNEVSGRQRPQHDLREDYFSTKDGKMLASYYGFLDNYGPPGRRPQPFSNSSDKPRFPLPSDNPRFSTLPDNPRPRPDTRDTHPGHSAVGQSMLLDPHHQPKSLARSRPPAITESIAEDEPGKSQPAPSAIESSLDDSWRMNLGGDESDHEDAEDVDHVVEGPGVLGLIQQFQRVNHERR